MNKKFLYLLWLVCLIATGVGCGGDEEVTQPVSTTGSVKVTVVDKVTSSPVSGAVVSVGSGTAFYVTDEDGKTTVAGMAAGLYMIQVQKLRYGSDTVEVQVTAGQVSEVRIEVQSDTVWPALSLSGESVTVPDDDALDLSHGSYTLEAYVYAEEFGNSSGNWNWVVSHGTSNAELDYLFGFENKRPALFSRSTSTVIKGTEALNTKQWYHLAAVQDTGSAKVYLYVDGVAVAEGDLSGAGVSTAGKLFIGARESFGSGTGEEPFKGVITEVRIWNVARSQEDINNTMLTTLSGRENGLAGYWLLNEGKGTVVIDHSGNGHHGVITGTPEWKQIVSPWK